MLRPKLSVLIATRNRPADLRLCLDSIDEDDEGNCAVEIVVACADDLVGDEQIAEHVWVDTKPWVTEYGAKWLYEPEACGWVRAMNAAAGYASGESLLWLGDDLTITPGTIKACIGFAAANPKAIGAVPWRDPGGEYHVAYHCGLLYANFGVVRRDYFWHLGGFDTRYYSVAGDTDISFESWAHGEGVKEVKGAAIDHLRRDDETRKEMEPCRDADGKLWYAKWGERLPTLGVKR